MVWYVWAIIGLLVFGGAMYYKTEETSDITKGAIEKGSEIVSDIVEKTEDKIKESKGEEDIDEEVDEQEQEYPDRLYMGKPECQDYSDCNYVEGCNGDCFCDTDIGECYILR